MAEEYGKNGMAWVDHSDVYLNNARLDEHLVCRVDTIQQGKHRHLLSKEEHLRDIRRELVRLQALRCAPSSVAKLSSLRPSSTALSLRRATTAPTQTASQMQVQAPGKPPEHNKATASAHPRMHYGNISKETYTDAHQRAFPRGHDYLDSVDKRSVTSAYSGLPTDDDDSSDSFDSDGSEISDSDSSRETTPNSFLPKSNSPPPLPPKKGSQLQARLQVLGLQAVPPHWYCSVVPAQDSPAKRVSRTEEYRQRQRELKRRKQLERTRAVSAPVPKAATQPSSRVLCAHNSQASMSRRRLQELTASEAPPTREMLRVTSHHRLVTAQTQANQRLEERVVAFLLSITKPRPKCWAGDALFSSEAPYTHKCSM